MDKPIVLFMFAGRRGNLEINLPMIRRILDENPRVTFHLWNLARERDDDLYIRALPVKGDDRIQVFHDFAKPRPLRYLSKVWDYYCRADYADTLFVKIDDDCVFIETEKFAEFVDHVEASPEHILTAEVVNNGACTVFMPDLWQQFLGLDIPLLDVHTSNEYARQAHAYMLANWRDLVARPTGLVEIETWLSINFVGMTWDMLRYVSGRIGRQSPPTIADREWRPGNRIGDEGAVNLFPRLCMTGFTVGHLGFGPQDLTAAQEDLWRIGYAEVAQQYLAGCSKVNTP